eukprot:snap_masked-scaffold_67-processed-gene-0.64-mRNA-1 protein AED:1.00 eAED:1.00 QI:0/0/0/0/1/1/2/0/141
MYRLMKIALFSLHHKPNDKKIPVNVLYAKSAESLIQHYGLGHVSGNNLSRIIYKFDTNPCTVYGESQVRANPYKKKISKKDSSSFVAVASGEKLYCDIIGIDMISTRYLLLITRIVYSFHSASAISERNSKYSYPSSIDFN